MRSLKAILIGLGSYLLATSCTATDLISGANTVNTALQTWGPILAPLIPS